MLTPKVTELTRAGSTWVLLPRMVAAAPKRPADVSLPAGHGPPRGAPAGPALTGSAGAADSSTIDHRR
jgi:hypothetical protein